MESFPSNRERLCSRPVRLAARLTGLPESELQNLFCGSRVLARIEKRFVEVSDAREILRFAVNQILRFCPNLAVGLEPVNGELLRECHRMASAIYGPSHAIQVVGSGELDGFDAILNVGAQTRSDLPWITVNSNGWVARIAPLGSTLAHLPWEPTPPNPLGAHAAATLGAGHVFMKLIGYSVPSAATEISLDTYGCSTPGSMSPGPPLPAEPLNLDALLVGCGAVANGWAYTIKRLPIVGLLHAVDRETLGIENLGPYVAAERAWLGLPKAKLIRRLLRPSVGVIPFAEEWELFKIRLRYGLKLPALIINGLDNVETRHSVQRLWPECLIDMASGGTTSQVILKRRSNEGLCLLRALTRPPDEVGYAERLAMETGLSVERVRHDSTSPITEADVRGAPVQKRAALERARRRGELVCGRINKHNLRSDSHRADFAPAAPFVSCLSGVIGAAETVKCLLGRQYPLSLHVQSDFRRLGIRALEMRCPSECECRVDHERSLAAP